jgi:CDP-diglyceride synthetase
LFEILAILDCAYLFGIDCGKNPDITNAASTWVGILAGIITGILIGWWIYFRQKRISDDQDKLIKRIENLDESHDKLLKSIEEILNQILTLDKKIDSIIENKSS